jgi:hypothetical protein
MGYQDHALSLRLSAAHSRKSANFLITKKVDSELLILKTRKTEDQRYVHLFFIHVPTSPLRKDDTLLWNLRTLEQILLRFTHPSGLRG